MQYKTAYDIQLPHENILFEMFTIYGAKSEEDPIPPSVDLLNLAMSSNTSTSIVEEDHKRLDANATGLLFTVSPYHLRGEFLKSRPYQI